MTQPTCFFAHVMKTGGTSFAQHINANFAPHERFPSATTGEQRQTDYYMIDALRALDATARSAIKVYAGHFPIVASELVGAEVTLSIVRDPVTRTISYLKHCKRYHPEMRDKRLEEIYEDPWVQPMYLRNHQSKLYAMRLDDRLESHLDVLEVDDQRLQLAVANLERVDVLGLTEHYADFLDDVRARLGWRIDPAPALRVSTEDWDVPPAFRSRIAADNEADLAFYDHARSLHRRRRRSA